MVVQAIDGFTDLQTTVVVVVVIEGERKCVRGWSVESLKEISQRQSMRALSGNKPIITNVFSTPGYGTLSCMVRLKLVKSAEYYHTISLTCDFLLDYTKNSKYVYYHALCSR